MFKATIEGLPASCKVLYQYASRVLQSGETIQLLLENEVLGVEKMVYILQEDILAFMQMKEIGQNIIVAYIG